MIFSKRKEATKKAITWCNESDVPISPFNIVTALSTLGYFESNEAAQLSLNTDSANACPKCFGYGGVRKYSESYMACLVCKGTGQAQKPAEQVS